ncbi:Haloacid dehalogenase-like hydrolase (HAD) superfamily protein isoform 1 [Hibiscus syriacus]|uniref:Haloacid dehalogenase-like hydrolase (HAD) superfamily protein isoform 1 n=2 Tax=Hibiscus syriacus TaxID=106335 RepID=A0A6A2YMR9_HIBSY|nr:Haloacid dehalogenase-like hydrolase (HAD) superfamily protein isoform 1 [Hibiscus syriacus]
MSRNEDPEGSEPVLPRPPPSARVSVAVMTRAFPEYSSSQRDLVLLQNIASYVFLACGLLYVFSGLLCIGFLKRSRKEKEITRNKKLRIWRNWRDEEKNLNKCCWQEGDERMKHGTC